MTHDQHSADAQEQQLLDHYRQQSTDEPGAALDVRIMAAARAALPASSWRQRLQTWWSGGNRRWSVALTGLACVGIGVSLTLRTLQQATDAVDAVPATRISASREAPSAVEASASGNTPRSERSAENLAAKTQSTATMADQVESAPLKKLAPPAPASAILSGKTLAGDEPRDSLLHLLQLRRAGQADAARQWQASLQAQYPELDIEAALLQLEQPASAPPE